MEKYVVIPASSSSLRVNLAHGNVWDITLNADCTFSYVDFPGGMARNFTLILRQDAVGHRHVVWPTGSRWPAATPLVLTEAAGAIDIVRVLTVDGGTNWFHTTLGIGFA